MDEPPLIQGQNGRPLAAGSVLALERPATPAERQPAATATQEAKATANIRHYRTERQSGNQKSKTMSVKNLHLADPQNAVKDIVESRLYCSDIKVYHYPDCHSLIGRLSPDQFGVILLDLSIPPLGGFQTMQALRDNGVQMPIITYTRNADIQTVKQAFLHGAVDFLDRDFADQALVNSVKVWMEKEEARQPSAEQAQTVRTMLGGLTGREIQVMNALCEGLTGKEVAAALGIAPRTVEVHRSNILHKMDARSLVQLVQKLQRAGYFDDRPQTGLLSAK